MTEDEDATLSALADAQGVSKNEAALRAILKDARTLQRSEEIRRATRDAIERYGPLLDRLAQ